MNEELMQKLGLLSAMNDNDNAPNDDADMFISSIRDAQTLLQQYMGPKGARNRKKIVDYITNRENGVFIEPDIYHNLVMDLFHAGDYVIAEKVCSFVLQYAPKNLDLLADALEACGSTCQFDRGEKYLAKAKEIPMELWSWRLFFYSVDFLKIKLKAYSDDLTLFSRASELAQQYMKYFPTDEHGYNQYAELLLCVNRREEAIQKLQEFIMETHPGGRKYSRLICPQCCVTLLSLLDESDDYDTIIDICDRGLAYTAQEQPSASIGFFVYRKALALDARAHNERLRNIQTILETLHYYQAAYDLNQGRSYARTIEIRYALLRIHVSDDKFPPLVKRPLYVEELCSVVD